MKTIFALCGLILVVGIYFIWHSMQLQSKYGDFVGAPKVEVSELVEHPTDFLNKTLLVEGTVREQCKTMGCYFFMPSGTKMLRIELKEVAMNAPMREGHQARVEGQVVPYGDGYQLFASAVEFK